MTSVRITTSAMAVLGFAFAAGAAAQQHAPAGGAVPQSAAPTVSQPPAAHPKGTPNAQPGNQTRGTQLPGQDRAFIRNAMQAGKTEVEAGKLAQQKATNDELKKFGERMAHDHSKAGDELKQIARQLNYQPRETRGNQDKLTMLQKLEGDQFDAAYAKSQLQAHEKAVALFRKEAQKGEVPQLKEYAQQTLQELEEHLAMAKRLPYASKVARRKSEHEQVAEKAK